MAESKINERVATLEELARHLATREDLNRLQREMEENFSNRFLQMDYSLQEIHKAISSLRNEVQLTSKKAENKFLKILIVAILAVPPIVDKGLEKFWP